MELRQVRYFLAVADTGTFTAAADRLGIVQSAVSQQIARLERELGEPLFDRSTRSPTLTAAGLRFHTAATQLIAAEEDAKGAARGRTVVRRLRIGVPGGLDHPVAQRTGADSVHLPSAERQARVADGELDAAIVHGDEIRSDLEVIDLPDDEVVAALSADHPLAHSRRAGLVDLQHGTLLLGEAAMGTHLARTVLKACRTAGFEADVRSVDPHLGLSSAIRNRPGAWSVSYADQARLLRPDRLGIRFVPVNPRVAVPTHLVVRPGDTSTRSPLSTYVDLRRR